MIGYLMLGVAVLAGGLLFLNWFANASPQAAKRALIVTGIVILGLVALAVASVGRIGFLLGLLIFLLPALLRLLNRRRVFTGAGNGGGAGGTGRQSEVSTEYLRMSLDQQTGEMSGEVLQGRFAGRQLGDLDQTDLLTLHEELRQEDRDGMTVLEAYLDRVMGPEWRQAAGGGPGGGRDDGRGGRAAQSASSMSRAEALDVLGLKEGATADEIKSAHRRLMAQAHPDRGGSDYMAAKINQAKEILLGR